MLPHPKNFKVLFSEEQIKNRIKELGAQISKRFPPDEDLTAICALKGSFVFYSDLIRSINRDIQCDFIDMSTHLEDTTRQFHTFTLDLSESIRDKHVLLIKDIVVTGFGLEYLKKFINIGKPKSLITATFLLRPATLKANINIDYAGFEIKEQCVSGYGLEHQGYFRNLPYVAQIRQNLN